MFPGVSQPDRFAYVNEVIMNELVLHRLQCIDGIKGIWSAYVCVWLSCQSQKMNSTNLKT